MSERYPGGLITKTPVTPSGPYETSTASGIWTLDQQAAYAKQGIWPTAGRLVPDAQFNYVTMLLHGDGTNGGQNNTFLDSSTNNFTITRNGNTTQGSFSPYGPNWSNYFDGSGDFLNFGTSSQLTLSGNFTAECWVFVESTTATFKRIFFNVAVGDTPPGYFYVYTNGTDIRMYNIDVGILPTVGSFTPNQWFHLAICRSGSTTRVFINGTQTYSYSGSTTFTNNGWIVGGGPSAEFHQGYISNHRVVVGSALYTSNFTPSTTPLTAVTNTRLLTCQSNRFIDNSTNNFAITRNGDVSVQRFSPFAPTVEYNPATIGGSGYFDGSGDFVTAPYNAAFQFGTGDFTVEAWIYLNQTPGNPQVVCSNYRYQQTTSFIMQINSSLQLDWYREYTGGGGGSLVSSNTLPARAWAHVAACRSGGTVRVFINGVQGGSAADSSSYKDIGEPFAIGAPSSAGAGQYGDFFNGYISNLRVVKGTALYTTNFTPPTAPITAVTNTSILTNFTNGAIFDNAMMNDLETVGNAQISTSVVKYGTGSMRVDGLSGAYLTALPATFDFGSSTDFTVEFWINVDSWHTYDQIIGQWGTYSTFQFANLGGVISVQDPSGACTSGVSTSSIATATWHHFAFVRQGSTAKFYLNGTGYTLSRNPTITPNYAQLVGIGKVVDQNGYGMVGYIDDLRITKGVARYTATFTPPTAAFPNTGPN